MEILESWEDDKSQIFAIVRHSKDEQEKLQMKEFEAMYLLNGKLESFGGSLGYTEADFDTPSMAVDFLLTGIYHQDEDPDIWLKMVEVVLPQNNGED